MLDPKNDIAFKGIFGREENKDIVIDFLNDMVVFGDREKIVDVRFLPTIQSPEVAALKASIVDVMCIDTHGQQYIVEMQVARTQGFEKRAQYYAAKAYISQMEAGQAYENLKEVIFLAITDFILFPQKESYKSDHVLLDKVTRENDLKGFSFTFVELPKFQRSVHELETRADYWSMFLKEPRLSEEERDFVDTGAIHKAYGALAKFSLNREFLHLYDQAQKRIWDAQSIIDYARGTGFDTGFNEGLEAGQKEGIEVGKKEGIEVGKKEGMKAGLEAGRREGWEEGSRQALLNMAKVMLASGVTEEQILTFTGLTKEDLGSLFT